MNNKELQIKVNKVLNKGNEEAKQKQQELSKSVYAELMKANDMVQLKENGQLIYKSKISVTNFITDAINSGSTVVIKSANSLEVIFDLDGTEITVDDKEAVPEILQVIKEMNLKTNTPYKAKSK